MKETKLGFRRWLSFIIAGFIGQLAWAIENNYLNLYVVDVTSSVSNNLYFVPAMTAASAAVATLTTIFIGALSDRVGKRKLFISLGYIIWGLSIIGFAFFDPRSDLSFITKSAFIAGVMIVVMDCLMTFFGSSANDAAFNAYVSDQTDTTNRGKVESVLSILPLIAMIAVTVIGGMFGIPRESAESVVHWDYFFIIFGGITLLVGIISIFFLPKDKCAPKKEGNYFENLFYGFRPKVIKENPNLYLCYLAFMVFNIAIQIFMPYILIYVSDVMLVTGMEFTITVGVSLLSASAITVVVGIFMDKIGKNKLIFPTLAITFIGGIILTLVKSHVGVMIGIIVIFTGYLISTAILASKGRDYYPEGRSGIFQGVRMVMVVLVPMVTGPYIGTAVSHINAIYDEAGDLLPNQYIFLATSIAVLFVLIPLLILVYREAHPNKPKPEPRKMSKNEIKEYGDHYEDNYLDDLGY